MSITIKGVAQRTLATLTMATTVLGLAGFAALTPATALAVAPADYGLHEGDVIRATGDIDVYIINDWGYKRLFVNPAIFGLYGHLSFANVKEVAVTTRDAFVTSGLFRNCETGAQAVYGLEVVSEDVANLHWINITGSEAVSQDPNFFRKVFCINNNEQHLYGTGSDYTNLSQVPNYARGGGAGPGPVAGFNPNGGTQGSIDSYALGSPAKTEALEGQSNVEIYAVDVKTANDGPLLLQSADVFFANSDNSSSLKPWDFFTTAKLMVGGTVVATKTVSNATDWSDDSDGQISVAGTTKEYRLRFTGFGAVLPSDATTKVSVAVSVVNTIDTVDQSAVWNVELGDHRVLDESGLTQTESDSNATELEDSFTVGTSDLAALTVRDAADPIAATSIKVNESTDTNNVAIYRFSIEETNGVAVDIDEMSLNFYAVSSQSDALAENDVFARARVKEGSTQRGSDESVSSIGSASFTNMNIHLNANQKKDFTVEVDLRDNGGGDSAANRYDEGAQIFTSVDPASLVFTDANGNDEGDITPDVIAVSNTHELRANGIQVSLLSVSNSKSTGAASGSDVATDVIKFRVTAFGSDAYIDKSTPSSSSNDGQSLYTITGEDNAGGAASLTTNTLVGDGTNGYRVTDGSSRDFTLTVAVTTASLTGVFVDSALTDLRYQLSDLDATAALDGLSYTFNLDNFKTGQDFIKVE